MGRRECEAVDGHHGEQYIPALLHGPLSTSDVTPCISGANPARFLKCKVQKRCYKVHTGMYYRELTSGTRLDLFVDVKASCARDTRLLNVAGANPGGTSVTFHLRKDRRASSHF